MSRKSNVRIRRDDRKFDINYNNNGNRRNYNANPNTTKSGGNGADSTIKEVNKPNKSGRSSNG